MWTARNEPLPDGRGSKFFLNFGPRPATFEEVLHGWQDDAEFRTFFNALLADAPYTAFRWETPALTAATVTRPFEFVLLDSPSLAREPEPLAFAEHFDGSNHGVAVFTNLGANALMVAPRPLAAPTTYGHLAAFVRTAPETQRHALWQAVGKTLAHRLSPKPVWLSTAGAGVSWLHVRLDDRPKYYGYAPYRMT